MSEAKKLGNPRDSRRRSHYNSGSRSQKSGKPHESRRGGRRHRPPEFKMHGNGEPQWRRFDIRKAGLSQATTVQHFDSLSRR